MAHKVQFWPVVGKLKSRSDENTRQNEFKCIFLVSGAVHELQMCQNDVMQSRGHPSTDTSGRGLSDMTSGKTRQDHRESAFSDIFGRVFLITGLCLASSDQKRFFTPFSGQKYQVAITKIICIGYSHPHPIWVLEWHRTTRDKKPFNVTELLFSLNKMRYKSEILLRCVSNFYD